MDSKHSTVTEKKVLTREEVNALMKKKFASRMKTKTAAVRSNLRQQGFGVSHVTPSARGKATQVYSVSLLPRDKREKLKVVCAGMCCGKTVLCKMLGAWDGDVLSAQNGLPCDIEGKEMVELRGDWPCTKPESWERHNSVMVKRTARSLANIVCVPQSGLVALHTAEMAEALELEVVCAVGLTRAGLENTLRITELRESGDNELADATIDISLRQSRSNALRDGFKWFDSVEALSAYVITELQDKGLTPSVDELERMICMTMRLESDVLSSIDDASIAVQNESKLMRESVSAAVVATFGGFSPDIFLQESCYVGWSQIVNAAFSLAEGRLPDASIHDQIIGCLSSKEWVEENFPYGPGTAKFALFNVWDLVGMCKHLRIDGTERFIWTKQLVFNAKKGRRDSYERLASMFSYEVYLWSSCPVRLAKLLTKLPLGALDAKQMVKVGKEIHSEVRRTQLYLGVHLGRHANVATYQHCLVGRVMDSSEERLRLEMEEVKKREPEATPKVYLTKDGESESIFRSKLCEEIAKVYATRKKTFWSVMNKVQSDVKSFQAFCEKRKRWARAGAAGMRAKVTLSADLGNSPAFKASIVTEAVGSIMLKLRASKSTLFESGKFMEAINDAFRENRPSSGTSAFIKKELGKFRHVFPANIMHYIMSSYVMCFAEKMGAMDKTRLNAGPEAPFDDAWLWQVLYSHSVVLMSDYADYNDQHDFITMSRVYESLGDLMRKGGYLPEDLEKTIGWLCASHENIMYAMQGRVVRFGHGLLSGWRCTTWINSILNVAYNNLISRQIVDLGFAECLKIEQTGGDDVASIADDIKRALLHLVVGNRMGLKFTGIKQAISKTTREFFRVTYSKFGCWGSLCRILGSASSGQWSNSVKESFMEPLHKIESYHAICAKIMRRSGELEFAELLLAAASAKWCTYKAQGVTITPDYIYKDKTEGGAGIPDLRGRLRTGPGVPGDPGSGGIDIKNVPYEASRSIIVDTMEDLSDKHIIQKKHMHDPDKMAKKMASDSMKADMFKANRLLAEKVMNLDFGVYTFRDAKARFKVLNMSGVERKDAFEIVQFMVSSRVKTIAFARRQLAKWVEYIRPEYLEDYKNKWCEILNISLPVLEYLLEGRRMYGPYVYRATEDIQGIAADMAIAYANIEGEINHENVCKKYNMIIRALFEANYLNY